MAVRAGYQQTEVGEIPEDWEVRCLSEHFRIFAGGDVPKHSLSSSRSERHPYPIFANALQRKGLYGYTGEWRAKKDSLTITGRGFLGHAEYRDEDFFPIVRLLVLEPIGELDARFATYAINDRVKFAFESTGVPQLTAPQVGQYSVAAPTKAEQVAIAEALSDADALIESLERLIAKKRQIKQGAMQQLLTPKKDWIERSIDEVAKVGRGRVISHKEIEKASSNLYPVFSSQTSNNGIMGYIDTYDFEGEYVTWTTDGAKAGTVFHRTGRFNCTNVCGTIRTNLVSSRFLSLSLSTEAPKHVSKHLGNPKLMNDIVKRIVLKFPQSIAEQTAIAETLSDMDEEIAALEAKLSKARQLKQGMMQELLTGKTRLPHESPAFKKS